MQVFFDRTKKRCLVKILQQDGRLFCMILAGSAPSSASRSSVAAQCESLQPETKKSIGTRLRRQALDIMIFFVKYLPDCMGQFSQRKGFMRNSLMYMLFAFYSVIDQRQL